MRALLVKAAINLVVGYVANVVFRHVKRRLDNR